MMKLTLVFDTMGPFFIFIGCPETSTSADIIVAGLSNYKQLAGAPNRPRLTPIFSNFSKFYIFDSPDQFQPPNM
jgi:hypothetical protein